MAVAGRPVPESDLVLLTGLTHAQVRKGLSDLHAASLLRPVREDEVELRHALLAEAVAGDLLPAERRDQHGRLADLLIARDRPWQAADICRHLAAAGRTAEELRWRVIAAGEAEHVFAPTAAAQHGLRAIALWEEVENAESVAGLSYFKLSETTRDALSDSGDDVGAGALTERVFARLGPSLTGDLAVRMYRALGLYRSITSNDAGMAAFATAVDIGSRLPPSREYVLALKGCVSSLRASGDDSTTDDLIERALVAARAGGFREEEKDLLALQATALVDRGSFVQAPERLKESMDIKSSDDPNTRSATLTSLRYDYVLGNLNEIRQATSSSMSAIRKAERAGLGDAYIVHLLRANVAEGLTELGDIPEATAFIDPITEGPPSQHTTFISLHRANLDLLRDRVADAERFWIHDQDETPREGLPERWELSWRRAEFALWLSRPEEALAAVRPLIDELLNTDFARATARLFALAARAYADLAENNGRRPGAAVAELDELLKLAIHSEVDPFAGPIPVTASTDGMQSHAERSRAAGQPSPELWAEAASRFEALERPHRAAYARWRQAEALLSTRGHGSEAADVLQTAASHAKDHMPLTRAIQILARRARIDVTPPDDVARDRAPYASTKVPFGLTDRELMVLRLVGGGKTNAEIGAALYISPKTASVHITNILRKLHAGSRVQAATVGERAGLLDAVDPTPAGGADNH